MYIFLKSKKKTKNLYFFEIQKNVYFFVCCFVIRVTITIEFWASTLSPTNAVSLNSAIYTHCCATNVLSFIDATVIYAANSFIDATVTYAAN